MKFFVLLDNKFVLLTLIQKLTENTSLFCFRLTKGNWILFEQMSFFFLHYLFSHSVLQMNFFFDEYKFYTLSRIEFHQYND